MQKNRKLPIPLLIISGLIFLAIGFIVFTADFSSISSVSLGQYKCYLDKKTATIPMSSDSTKTVQEFTIASGDSLEKTALALQDKHLISDTDYFICYIKQNNLDTLIQAGYFEININTTIAELGKTLQKATIPTIKVTIPEGLMTQEIATILEKSLGEFGNFKKKDFLDLTQDPDFLKTVDFVQGQKTLEGYLFPATYDIRKNANAKVVLEQMLETFDQKVLTSFSKELLASKYTLKQIITIASLVEREEPNPQQMKMVSDIIIRRYKEDWPLQIDAALLYYFKDWQHIITFEDIMLPTKYNTRNKLGLPPTPIANPGIASIKATLNPQANDYWFYIHDKKGQVHFAKTDVGHNQNVQKYLR